MRYTHQERQTELDRSEEEEEEEKKEVEGFEEEVQPAVSPAWPR